MYQHVDQLKASVLPAEIASRDAYDTALEAMGAGVAAAFDRHCNRQLARAEGDTYEFRGDSTEVVLPRYPVETISALEERDAVGGDWASVGVDSIRIDSPRAGLVSFDYVPADRWRSLRVTYTGGYWLDTTADASGSLPNGATALPADLLLAWHLQLRAEIESTDLLRGGAARKPSKDEPKLSPLSALQLIPRVAEMLAPYRRFA